MQTVVLILGWVSRVRSGYCYALERPGSFATRTEMSIKARSSRAPNMPQDPAQSGVGASNESQKLKLKEL
jgi:hypothetical protein